MSRELRQSTAQTELIGPFLDVGDGFSEETGLTTPPTEISKDGGTYGTGPAGGTHDSDGWYPVAFTTAHTDTLGSLMLKSHDSTTHLPVWHEFEVITANAYDSKYGTDVREVDVIQWLGTAAAAPTVAGVPEVDVTHWVGSLIPAPVVAGIAEVDVVRWRSTTVAVQIAAGFPRMSVSHWDDTFVATPTVAGVPEVDLTHMIGVNQSAIDLKDFADDGYDPATDKVQGVVLVDSLATDAVDAAALATDAVNEIAAAIGPQKNQAFSDLGFLMVLSSDGKTPATGLTVTGERMLDGAAFVGVSGTIAEVSDGIYQLDALAADMNGATVTFRFSSATALDTFITIKTTP